MYLVQYILYLMTFGPYVCMICIVLLKREEVSWNEQAPRLEEVCTREREEREKRG